MVKIALSVDNHFDVNRVDGFEMLKKQAAYLVEHDYQIYVNAGDTYNDSIGARHRQNLFMQIQRINR